MSDQRDIVWRLRNQTQVGMRAQDEAADEIASLRKNHQRAQERFQELDAEITSLRAQLDEWEIKWQRECMAKVCAEAQLASARKTLPVIAIKPMELSDGSTDYFVAITVGDREITPYKLHEEWQAQYEADSLRWLLLGAEKPDLMAYGPSLSDEKGNSNDQN